jgi:hypothetical protein
MGRPLEATSGNKLRHLDADAFGLLRKRRGLSNAGFERITRDESIQEFGRAVQTVVR